MLLASPSVGLSDIRFNLGVFVMTTPDTALGESPRTYTVSGFDQLYLLQTCIGDSYAVGAGENVLDAVRQVLASADIHAPVLLDTSGSAKTLATAMVWPQTSSDNPTWILVANDLLAAIGYRGLWCDQDGTFRSGPYVLPQNRPVEWVFDVGSLTVGMVADGRTVVNDLWSLPNWMTFVRNGLTTTPVNGSGMYVVSNWSNGPSSVDSVERIVKGPTVYLDAVSQDDLEIQGDRLFAAATRTSEVITAKVSPFPAAGHFDQVTYNDPDLGIPRRAQCRSWSLPLSGEDGDYILEVISE
jgi:hypothetical protein